MGQLKQEIRKKILQTMTFEQMADEELAELIDQEIANTSGGGLHLKDRLRLQKELFDSFRRLDILQELVENPEITEIMVNGPDDIFIESGGEMRRWDKTFDSKEQLLDLIQQIVSSVNRIVNTSTPIADARLADGSRVHAVLEPVALNGPVLTIRKFPEPVTMERLLSYGSISEEAAELLKTLVIARYNIFVSGGTGAGKTTFLNALSEYIPAQERVITIEDSAAAAYRKSGSDGNQGCECGRAWGYWNRRADPGGAAHASVSDFDWRSKRQRGFGSSSGDEYGT